MRAPEGVIEVGACAYATSKDLEHRKLAWIGRRDAPDRIFWGEDIPIFFIEFKAPGKTLRPGQVREVENLRRSGVRVYVCSDPQAARAHIDMEIRHAAAIDAY